MDEKTRKDIEARLARLGRTSFGISKKKMLQLEAIRAAAIAMNEACKEAEHILKTNAITVANMERKLLERGGVTVTDQTMHNGGGFLEAFMMTFEEPASITAIRRELKDLRKSTAEQKARLEAMHKRDAVCEKALIELEEHKKRISELERDRDDMQKRIDDNHKMQKTVVMTQLDLTKSKETFS